jgi:hypothetical protein
MSFLSTKFQTPNPKQIRMNQIPNSKQEIWSLEIDILEFEDYLGFGAWNLGFSVILFSSSRTALQRWALSNYPREHGHP